LPDCTFSTGSTTRLIDVVQLVASNYTITDVDPRTREWEYPKGSGNFNLSYKVKVKERDQELEHSRKKGKPAPAVGEVIFGVIEESKGDFPDKLKKVQQGGGGSWSPSKRDPAEVKAIQRQHSQEMALRSLELAQKLNLLTASDTPELFRKIQGTADWFDRDIANGKAGE
jgi:hypothetical protein